MPKNSKKMPPKPTVESKTNKNPFKKVDFSNQHVLIFAVAFALLGGFVIWKSFAAGVTTWGTFENGFSEFSDSSCGSSKVDIVSSPVREGSKAALFNGGGSCYGDTVNSRIHFLGFKPGTGVDMNNGSTFWWAYSLRVPSNSVNSYWYGGPEIHQSSTANGCDGPAPFNMSNFNGKWSMVVRGSNTCDPTFNQTVFGGAGSDRAGSSRKCIGWANGISPNIVGDQWYDFMIGWHMATDNSGWFEAWVNGPGTNGKSIQVVPRAYMQTDYPSTNYPMDSMYYQFGGSDNRVTNSLFLKFVF